MASVQLDMQFHIVGKTVDDKQNFKTIAEMKAYPELQLSKTAMATNDEDGKLYVYNVNNEVNENTGKWKSVDDLINSGSIPIYDDYSKFPTITKDVIVYAKSNYEDVDNGRTYKSGFYFGELDTLKYIAISRGDSSVADWTSNIEVGGLDSNTDLNGLTSMEILKKITRKYVNCNATVTWSQVNTIIEKNTSFNLDISVSGFVNGDNECSKVVLYKDGTIVEQLDITDLSTTLSFTTVNNVDTNSKFEVKILDSGNVESVVSSKEYIFVEPTYVGVLDGEPVSDTDVTSLNKLLRTKATLTQKYTTTGLQTIVFASIWQLTSIINQNNYEVISNFTNKVININGTDYYVYSLSDVNLNNFAYTFKY